MNTTLFEELSIQTVLDSGFYIYQKPRDPNPHRHSNFELYFVESGKCTAFCTGQKYDLFTNDILIINSGAEHNICDSAQDSSLYSLRCSFYQLEEQNSYLYEDLMAKLQFPLYIKNQSKLVETLKLCRWELSKQQFLCTEKLQALLQIFYVDFIRTLTNRPSITMSKQPFSITLPKESFQKGFRGSPPEDFYTDVMDDFFTHLPHENATLTELSNRLYLSVRHTQRLVERYYGMSFKQKIMNTKVLKGARLIAGTDMSLEHIAELVGYNSYNAFFEAFTLLMKKTPSEYRQSLYKKQ
ncbi:MAG: helix-turn-helix domain-containing protein [Clostridia bacterium]|nr:helix-turn-helix domain-containing protein [Clostridia bacterium]